MREREKGRVVYEELNVYRTSRWKVLDWSMVLGDISTSTKNTVLMTGENATAVITRRELGTKV